MYFVRMYLQRQHMDVDDYSGEFVNNPQFLHSARRCIALNPLQYVMPFVCQIFAIKIN